MAAAGAKLPFRGMSAPEGKADTPREAATSVFDRFCSLIPGLGVKRSNDIFAGPTVLSR